MPSRSFFDFLSLPRELRDIIYHYYVFEDEGYHFNYELGKLQASNNRPISLTLMYTCKSIAAEMRGLSLRTNVIKFLPIYSERERIKAGRFHLQVCRLSEEKHSMVGSIARSRSPSRRRSRPPVDEHSLLSEEAEDVARNYPEYLPLFKAIYTRALTPGEPLSRSTDRCGEAPSSYRQFINYAFKLLYADSDFTGWLVRFNRPPMSMLDRVVSLSPTPWVIPSEHEVDEMDRNLSELLNLSVPWKSRLSRTVTLEKTWKRIKYHYSAATAAIYFLKSISSTSRLQIRNIVLSENRECIAFPECHALGLIPFCSENPRLHIERRVNLWRAVLPGGSYTSLFDFAQPYDNLHYYASVHIDSHDITDSFAIWMTEVLALFNAGMPVQSFSFVFDGDPDPIQSSQIFAIVKKRAGWQVALDQWYLQDSLTPSFSLRGNRFYQYEAFAQTIEDMIKGRSCFRCNFPIGSIWDVGQVLEKNRHCRTYRDWVRSWWDDLVPREIPTLPPLPEWLKFRNEQVILEDQDSDRELE